MPQIRETVPRHRSSRRWRPAIVVALCLLSACTAAVGPEATVLDAHLRVETVSLQAPLDAETTVAEPAALGFIGRGTLAEREPLLPEGVAVIAIPRQRLTKMWEDPGRREPDFLFDARNPLGAVAPLLVARARRMGGVTWYEVYLPVRPNGRTAWLRASDVKVRQRDQRIEVDLSNRTLRYVVDGELVDEISVGIGTPATPTAIGTFYVWVKVHYEDPSNPYGILALGLSGHSEVLTDWPGGGRLAVHGTSNASDRGHAVSHGCVRVYNGDMHPLFHVPLGTPVLISR